MKNNKNNFTFITLEFKKWNKGSRSQQLTSEALVECLFNQLNLWRIMQVREQAPCEYFGKALHQCETKAPVLGNIVNCDMLKENLEGNCIPENVITMDASNYEDFLTQRRKLIASMLEHYYRSL